MFNKILTEANPKPIVQAEVKEKETPVEDAEVQTIKQINEIEDILKQHLVNLITRNDNNKKNEIKDSFMSRDIQSLLNENLEGILDNEKP